MRGKTQAPASETVRRDYAREMLRHAGVVDPMLEAALAAVPCEAFLGSPPWAAGSAFGFRSIDADHVESLYKDVLVALDSARGVNNGSPSPHALMLHRLQVRPDQRVCHIGAGTGYYSAILSHLVGPDGRLDAVEYDDALARRAEEFLAGYANVQVERADGRVDFVCAEGSAAPVRTTRHYARP